MVRTNFLIYVAASAVACAIVATPAMAQSVRFNIPEQDAAVAIPAFARASTLQILVSAPLLRGIRTNDVVGSFDRRAALELLIRGTGLRIATWKGDFSNMVSLVGLAYVRPWVDRPCRGR